MSAKCDFCYAADPEWVYPAEDFPMPNYGWGSGGAWTACEACSKLIEAGEHDRLVERVMRRAPNARAAAAAGFGSVVRREMRVLHQRFRESRKGARRAFG
jgi:hypothetical protein